MEVRAESHTMEDPGVTAADRARALFLRGQLQEATSGLSEATSGPSNATDADAVRIANTKLNLAEVEPGRCCYCSARDKICFHSIRMDMDHRVSMSWQAICVCLYGCRVIDIRSTQYMRVQIALDDVAGIIVGNTENNWYQTTVATYPANAHKGSSTLS